MGYFDKLDDATLFQAAETPLGSVAEKSKMNIDEAAEYLNYSKSTLYKLTSDFKIPFHKPLGGQKLTLFKEELDEWLRIKN